MNFNNWLAAGVVLGCFGIAVGQGLGVLNISEFILGALYTVGFTLVIQHYFRKAPAKDNGDIIKTGEDK